MSKAVKYAEKAAVYGAQGAWVVFERLNRISPNASFTPKWSDKPLLKSYQKEKPPLGWPRTTDSLCPKCVPEIRQQIVDGKLPHEILLNEKVGEIKAQIIERDGQILMVKDCPIHGHFEDVMSIDTAFFKHLEEVFPGRDIRAHNDEKLHNHGTSTVTHGRGSVLTIDLTNRCNMMCDPCFMDANQVGFVHELTWDEIKTMLDNAITIKPKRQMSRAVLRRRAHALALLPRRRRLLPQGRLQLRPGRDQRHRVRQVQGVLPRPPPKPVSATPTSSSTASATPPTRTARSATLFDVKLQAIHNLHEAGVDIVPVTTIINGINNEQVGRIIEFALDNPKKINFLSFQPVSFTGRDEEITDERRHAQRYTLSHLAHDVKNQTGLGEPTRDWFPISFMSTFSDWADLVHGPDRRLGPALLRLPSQLRHRHGADDRQGNQGSRARHRLPQRRPPRQGHRHASTTPPAASVLSIIGVGLALLRNYEPDARRPPTSRSPTCCRSSTRASAPPARNYGKVTGDRTMEDIKKRRADRWNFLFIAGMWFQDLFNYDFRRTEQCIIPYATQEGEISFCAYNTGVGWRNIIEKMHMTSTLTKWYEEHGRHEIFAGGKKVGIETSDKLRPRPQRGARQLRRQRHLRQVRHRQERSRRKDSRPRSARKTPKTPRWPSSTANMFWAKSRSKVSSRSTPSGPPRTMPPHRSTGTGSRNPTSSPATRTARPANRASRHSSHTHRINKKAAHKERPFLFALPSLGRSIQSTHPTSISMSLLISPARSTISALEDPKIETTTRRRRPVFRRAHTRPRPTRRLRSETRLRLLGMARSLRPVHRR